MVAAGHAGGRRSKNTQVACGTGCPNAERFAGLSTLLLGYRVVSDRRVLRTLLRVALLSEVGFLYTGQFYKWLAPVQTRSELCTVQG